MFYFTLLIAGNILVETSGFTLNCTNDYEKRVSCYIYAQNCSGLGMTFRFQDDEHPSTETCTFDLCVRGCCCSVEMAMKLAVGDIFKANVYKDGHSVLSETIDVHETIKPRRPSIDPVVFVNGVYRIPWRTNVKKSIRIHLMATVTYQKKGDYTKNFKDVTPSQMEDRNYFQILARDLEPRTTYVVSVKTITSFGVSSESSNEMEFTTASSTNGIFIAIILLLCVVAIVISGLAFASFVKLKGKLWDSAAKNEKPKLMEIKPYKNVILIPESLSVYSLCIEPLVSKDRTLSKESLSDTSGKSDQTSGISTASSSLNYTNTEPVNMEVCLKNVFPIISPAEDTFSSDRLLQSSTIPLPFEKISSSIVFDNKSYISTENNQTDDKDMQMVWAPGYYANDGPTLTDFILLPHFSEMDMSYQPCTQSEDASSESQNLLPVVYGYQGLERLDEQSSNMSSVEKPEWELLIPDLMKNRKIAEVVQSPSGITTHVSNELIVDHGYHCV